MKSTYYHFQCPINQKMLYPLGRYHETKRERIHPKIMNSIHIHDPNN